MPIKAIITFSVLIILLSSCKKNYVCNCITYVTYKTSSGYFNTKSYPGDKTKYNEKLTEKQARSACSHMETAIQSNITNWFTYNGKYVILPGESITTKCDIVL